MSAYVDDAISIKSIKRLIEFSECSIIDQESIPLIIFL